MAKTPKTPWRELNVEQMASWDAIPRRSLLTLLGFVLFLLAAVYVIMPAYVDWQQARTQTQMLQEQYKKLALSAAQASLANTSEQERVIVPLNASELNLWLADLGTQAQAQGLLEVSIKPIASATKSNDKAVLSPAMGQLSIKVEGAYGDVVRWWAQLANSSHVLSMGSIEFNGVTKERVRGQVVLVYAQGGQP